MGYVGDEAPVDEDAAPPLAEPSMSMAPRLTKCFSDSKNWAGQAELGQRCMASPSSLTTAVSHSGHRSGIRNCGAAFLAGHGDGADDVGDDVAGALDFDHVADADVLAVDVLLVVEGRVLNGCAADDDRLQDGLGVEAAGASDVDDDVEEAGVGAFGGELVGDGPAGFAAGEAEGVLLGNAIDLDDQAVGLVVPVVATFQHLIVVSANLIHGIENEVAVVDPESPRTPARPGRPNDCPAARVSPASLRL